MIQKAADFIQNSEGNYVSKQAAISERSVGMKIYEEPIFGFGSADDGYFIEFKDPSVIGEHFLAPREWLPGARTVVSFFLPFSEAVRKGNLEDAAWPSEGWLHGRIEGQAFLNQLCAFLRSELIDTGYNSLAPSLDGRFWSKAAYNADTPHPGASFTSNWSERHAAFVCGLGTFGLSKGLITAKGIAGRFGSVITELYLPPDPRGYDEVYGYCTMCGSCVKNCPVRAISLEEGKKHPVCSRFLDRTSEKYKPRYGCGKCQVGVPCEAGIPEKPAAGEQAGF